MPCGCRDKARFAVQVNGKTVYVSSNEATAQAVARRYTDAQVIETTRS